MQQAVSCRYKPSLRIHRFVRTKGLHNNLRDCFNETVKFMSSLKGKHCPFYGIRGYSEIMHRLLQRLKAQNFLLFVWHDIYWEIRENYILAVKLLDKKL